MKTVLFTMAMTLLGGVLAAQSADVSAIKSAIKTFVKAGDENDPEKLNSVLDDNYRVVMNQLFGSEKVDVMPREVHVEKIRTREFGGDDRKLTFHEVLINGNTAMAKVTLKGSQLTFVSLLTLAKDKTGNWKLVSDVPVI